jgi:hypothetical protein
MKPEIKLTKIIGSILTKLEINLTKIIGHILLAPALTSVLLFFIQLFTGENLMENLISITWVGTFYVKEYGGAGYTSALPFYFGLMAIAGAYLIKDNKK